MSHLVFATRASAEARSRAAYAPLRPAAALIDELPADWAIEPSA